MPSMAKLVNSMDISRVAQFTEDISIMEGLESANEALHLSGMESKQQGGLPLQPSMSITQMSNGSNTRQLVNTSDIFNLLRTAESGGRLSPEKGSRLRRILIEADAASINGGVCWMNIVFRVLCELIPAPACPTAVSVCPSVEKSPFGVSSPREIQQLDVNVPGTNSNLPMVDQNNMKDIEQGSMFKSPPAADEISSAESKPCSQPNITPVSSGCGSKDNDDAVAALLDMKMNSSTLNSKRKRSSTRDIISEEPPFKTSVQAIYPYPFSSAKDPKLYRRTRCKVPNCQNNGRACPDHGHNIKICTVEECQNRAVKGGVCSKHGAKRPLCRVEGCTNQAKREGKCIKHGAVYGNCSEKGCRNQARSGGLCRKHGAK